MQKKASFLVLFGGLVLSACGGGDNSQNQPVAAKPLKTMVEFKTEDGQLTQKSLYKFSYSNGRLARVDYFDESGTDQKWNTTDDTLYSYSTCEFSGKISEPVRVPEIEFVIKNPMETSVSGTILAATLGINKNPDQSLCANDYKTDQSFNENVFIPRFSDDVKPFFKKYWRAQITQGKVTGSQTGNVALGFTEEQLDKCEGNDSVPCDQTFFGAQNHKKFYQYLGTDYLADIKAKILFQYIKQDGKLKTVNVYRYEDTPEVAVANLNRQVKTGSIDYTYQGNQTRICSRNADGTGNSLHVNTFQNGQIKQADIYDEGADKLDCTADDVVVSRTVYTYS